MDVVAKYVALGEKLEKETVTAKLFEELRPLGALRSPLALALRSLALALAL